MQKGQRLRFVAIFGLVVALTTAGFALAGDPFDTPGDPQPTVCPPTGGTVNEGGTDEDDGTVDEGGTPGEGDGTVDEGGTPGEGDGTVDEGGTPGEGDEDESAECDETEDPDDAEVPTVDEGQTGEEQAATEASPERIAECTEAAGLIAADAPTEKPVPGELKGLENAIAHVLWNCTRNDNDGLVNALHHLSANLEQKQLRDEAKAERKAAHDAAKAERKAAHAAAKAARALSHAS
jgi:hypothetical protein